jgi:hypothetical protein
MVFNLKNLYDPTVLRYGVFKNGGIAKKAGWFPSTRFRDGFYATLSKLIIRRMP